MTEEKGDVVASFDIHVVLRSKGEYAKIPTSKRLEEIVAFAVETESIENGGGNNTVTATATADRTDR